jgi:hypothetical protein
LCAIISRHPAKAGNPGRRVEGFPRDSSSPHSLSKPPWITRPSRVMTDCSFHINSFENVDLETHSRARRHQAETDLGADHAKAYTRFIHPGAPRRMKTHSTLRDAGFDRTAD